MLQAKTLHEPLVCLPTSIGTGSKVNSIAPAADPVNER